MAKIDITKVTASTFYKSEAFGPGNLIDDDKEFGGWITDVAAWQDAWIDMPSKPRRFSISSQPASSCTSTVASSGSFERSEKIGPDADLTVSARANLQKLSTHE